MTMTNDAFKTACTKAVARLLLGNRKLKEGIVLTGGNRLDLDGKVRLARQARASGTDVLHLEYGINNDGRPALTGMIVFMVRGDICHIQTQCRLFLAKGGTRGVVLPQPGARGHYRLAPGEILHIDGKPAMHGSPVSWPSATTAPMTVDIRSGRRPRDGGDCTDHGTA